MLNIAIISSNREMCRFIEIELINMECKVSLFLPSETVSDVYDLLIVDKDTVKPGIFGISKRMIFLTSDSEKLTDEETYLWPISIRGLHSVVFSLVSESNFDVKNTSYSQDGENVVRVEDTENRIVCIDNYRVKLSETEFLVLERLCAAQGGVVSTDTLMQLIGAKNGNIAVVYMCHLRAKLEKPLGRRLIFTKRGQGYYTVMTLEK